VGFVVDKVAEGQVSVRVFVASSLSFIYHRYGIVNVFRASLKKLQNNKLGR
jgi:hypothetical protein